ncbi:MAG: glycosyltransferase [Candidatus Obscuribacterales bacterium]|nr:glycosyltransferase [Steroidobacteraceae bacterium]
MKPKVRINFSDFWHPDTLEAKRSNPIYQLLSERFELEICERPDFLIYSCFGLNFLDHKCVRIFYTGENKRPNYSLCDWAFGYDHSDDPRYFRWPYYALYNIAPLLEPRDVEAVLRKKTRFCAFVYSNERARERLRFLDKLSRYKPVDCGGKVRNNLGYRVADKVAFLQAYKFNIAFENECYPGYTSEKLLESFHGNTVPIYWGNPLVNKDFNSAAFINSHDYRNLNQLVEYVVEVDRSEDLYRRYASAPAFVGGRPNEYIDKARVLDRFERIFTTSLLQPVAQTPRGRLAGLVRELKRYRQQSRQRSVT